MNLWLDDVHTPWVPGPEAAKGDTRANFRAVLAETDRQIGRLLEALRQRDLENSTLVIFTSDNGPLPTFDASRSAGLRGAKLSLYESGIRVPFIVRWPGHVPAGRVDDTTLVCGVDMFPTLCAIAGAPLPATANLDGEDLSAALRGSPGTRGKPLFWEYGRNSTAFKFPPNPRDRSPTLAIRESHWKLLVEADGSAAELYHIITDPRETSNVAAEHADVARKLTGQLLSWRKSLP